MVVRVGSEVDQRRISARRDLVHAVVGPFYGPNVLLRASIVEDRITWQNDFCTYSSNRVLLVHRPDEVEVGLLHIDGANVVEEVGGRGKAIVYATNVGHAACSIRGGASDPQIEDLSKLSRPISPEPLGDEFLSCGHLLHPLGTTLSLTFARIPFSSCHFNN